MKAKIIVLGGGISAVSFAFFLKTKSFLILEKNAELGGLLRTREIRGFKFDKGGHVLHLRNPIVVDLIVNHLMQNKLVKKERKAKVFLKGQLIDYPFQYNFNKLGDEVIVQDIRKTLPESIPEKYTYKSLEEWLLLNFGKGLYKWFFNPYLTKLLKTNLSEVDWRWGNMFIPVLSEGIRKILKKGGCMSGKVGYNPEFYYPLQGGIQHVIIAFLKNKKEIIQKSLTNCRVEAIDVEKRRVITNRGYIDYKFMVSTIPLKDFLEISTINDLLKDIAKNLRYVSLAIYNYGFKGDLKVDAHWIYVPEEKYTFHRIIFPSNICKNNAPKGSFSISVESSLKPGEFPKTNSWEILENLKNMGIISEDSEPIVIDRDLIEIAYVVFHRKYFKDLDIIRRELTDYDIWLLGRFGSWEYSFIEKNILDAMRLANVLKKYSINQN